MSTFNWPVVIFSIPHQFFLLIPFYFIKQVEDVRELSKDEVNNLHKKESAITNGHPPFSKHYNNNDNNELYLIALNSLIVLLKTLYKSNRNKKCIYYETDWDHDLMI